MGAGGFALPPAAFVGGCKRVLLVEFVGRGEPGPLLVEIVSSDESVSLVVVVVGPGSVVSVDIVGSGVFLWEIMGPDKPECWLTPPGGGDKGGRRTGLSLMLDPLASALLQDVPTIQD